MANTTATLVLRALALALVVAAASAAADRQLLGGGSNKNCTGLPSGVTGTTLAPPCDLLTPTSTSARGTKCAFTCVAPGVGAGGNFTCQDRKWKVTSGSPCRTYSLKVEVEGDKKVNSTLKLEAKLKLGERKVSNVTLYAFVPLPLGAISGIVANATTNREGKAVLRVRTPSPPWATNVQYKITVFADVDGSASFTPPADPSTSVFVTLKSGWGK